MELSLAIKRVEYRYVTINVDDDFDADTMDQSDLAYYFNKAEGQSWGEYELVDYE